MAYLLHLNAVVLRSRNSLNYYNIKLKLHRDDNLYVDKIKDNEYDYQYRGKNAENHRLNGVGVENSTSVEVEENEVICKCFQVTESTIRSHIAKNDLTEIEDVTSVCEAGGNCASCHILIQLFIDQNKHIKALKKHDLGDINSKKDRKGFWKKIFTNS